MEVASIKQFCRRLHMPTIAGQCVRLSEQAIKEKRGHLAFLDALLEAEVEEREKNVVARRMKEAHFPKVKTLEEIDFETATHLPAARLRKLSEGEYLIRTEPVIFLGDTGTGKTHLATALAVAACQQRRRVRFTTAAELINELVEARENNEVSRAVSRWMRYELIVLDELCYVAMPEPAAELLFQVIAGRAERAGVIVTTNLPFSEWTTMIPNARLCKAMVDRLTDQAHIIETGTESYRFRRTVAKNKGAKA
jgi:DNA replication protein DnaC